MHELTLLIADDHKLIRRGLRDLLAMQTGWRVIGEACDGAEAVEMTEKLRSNIVILDFFMPQLSGSAAASQIISKMPDTGVLVLTMDDSEHVVREVLQSGASGLVLKSEADRDLLRAIHSVAENRQFFAGHVAKVVLGKFLNGAEVDAAKGKSRGADLTNREVEILRLLAQDFSSKRVAIQLQISVRTVESHRTNISRKLHLSCIADLVRYAIREGSSRKLGNWEKPRLTSGRSQSKPSRHKVAVIKSKSSPQARSHAPHSA